MDEIEVETREVSLTPKEAAVYLYLLYWSEMDAGNAACVMACGYGEDEDWCELGEDDFDDLTTERMSPQKIIAVVQEHLEDMDWAPFALWVMPYEEEATNRVLDAMKKYTQEGREMKHTPKPSEVLNTAVEELLRVQSELNDMIEGMIDSDGNPNEQVTLRKAAKAVNMLEEILLPVAHVGTTLDAVNPSESARKAVEIARLVLHTFTGIERMTQ